MVKRIAGVLDPVVGRARVRGERLVAIRAPVSSSLACLGPEKAVPDDIALVHLSVPLTVYIGANPVDAARHGSPLYSAGQKLDSSLYMIWSWGRSTTEDKGSTSHSETGEVFCDGGDRLLEGRFAL